MAGAISEQLRAILSVLRDACDLEETDALDYVSEWLGYLPFGQYHWVEVGSRTRVEQHFPASWSRGSLEELCTAGHLEEISRTENGDDERVRYRLTASGRRAAAEAPTGEATAKKPKRPADPSKILGTVQTEDGQRPFSFDTSTKTLKLGFDWPERTPTEPSSDDLDALDAALRDALGIGIAKSRVGHFQCYDCGQWFDVRKKPSAWSYGMCLSCSMDRSSELADMD